MSEWTPDERTRKQYGPYELVSLRPKGGGETAHLVAFPDGRGIRVLPDGHSTGRRRYSVLAAALTTLEALAGVSAISQDAGFDPVVYLIGACRNAGLEWESSGDMAEVTIEDWLAYWWQNEAPNMGSPDFKAECLLGALDDDGWEIVRRDA